MLTVSTEALTKVISKLGGVILGFFTATVLWCQVLSLF
jgi:hypothetical protein